MIAFNTRFRETEGGNHHEMWLGFEKLLLKCPTNGIHNDLLLQYYYQSLDSVDIGVVGQLVEKE